MTLAEDLQFWRIERPDEWKMDEFIRMATALQSQLTERDKEIARLDAGWHDANVEVLGLKQQVLEQQALVDDIFKTAEKAKDTPNVYAWEIGLGNVIALASQISPSSIESALKAERIKTLEKAADYLSMHFVLMHNTLLLCGELRRMAKELEICNGAS